MLNIDIVTADAARIVVGKSLPSIAVKRNGLYPNRKFFKLMAGTNDIKEDTPCEKVILIGDEYIINNRRYDLTCGFGIVAQMTPDYKIYPELRRAEGKEIGVIKDQNGFGILDDWPVLEDLELQKETTAPAVDKQTEEESFSEEAIQFDVSDESFSEYDYDSNEEDNED